jgi:Ca2+-binding RTX toxin-like protein
MATRRRAILALAAACVVLSATAISAQASEWQIGDVFANTPAGPTAVKVYDNSGNFKEEFGSAGLSGEGTGCGFNANHDLYATFFQMNETHRFSSADPHADVQTISNPGSNESIVFDAAGNYYIGIADPTGTDFVRKYDPAGNLLDSYSNLATDRGADWIELAADQRTLFYDGEGQTVRRYDLATHTQLADFATVSGGEAFALRLLPPGDGSGGLLVADGEDIKRLDGAGNVVQDYDVPGVGQWFALNLDPNGTSFWSADISGGTVYRFNIASGAVEVGPIQAHPTEVAGLCVLGELTAAVPPAGKTLSAKAKSCQGKKGTVIGTSGSDKLVGTKGRDVIIGLGGKDRLKGLNGNDFLCGGRGSDNLLGGSGSDTLIGGAGPDHLDGGGSHDHLFGGTPHAPPQNSVDTCKGHGDAKRNCEKVG